MANILSVVCFMLALGLVPKLIVADNETGFLRTVRAAASAVAVDSDSIASTDSKKVHLGKVADDLSTMATKVVETCGHYRTQMAAILRDCEALGGGMKALASGLTSVSNQFTNSVHDMDFGAVIQKLDEAHQNLRDDSPGKTCVCSDYVSHKVENCFL